MGIKCFFLEPAGKLRRALRRYSSGTERGQCPLIPGEYSSHNASTPFDVVEDLTPEGNYGARDEEAPAHDDPRWPTRCGCGYAFTGQDEFQLSVDRLYRRTDTGEEMTLGEAGPGAMWDATWYHDIPSFRGPDGRALVVRCPNGAPWHIDGRASNCTLKDDDVHKCWVRHGEPPLVTVDKNGQTCAAGAGSIQAGDYHGFLRNGVFEP